MACRHMSWCARCGKEFYVDELHELPEVEAYERVLATSRLRGTEPPAMFDEDALKKKYGYGSTEVFCDVCLAELAR